MADETGLGHQNIQRCSRRRPRARRRLGPFPCTGSWDTHGRQHAAAFVHCSRRGQL